MCGIMGYVGPQQAATVLLDGLRRLEYRGYDSAGIAVANGAIAVLKAEGKIDRLQAVVDAVQPPGTIGIGHTRWATHGAPTEINAHPHTTDRGEIAVIHNGIIENYNELKTALRDEGHSFTSETDTEILAHLIEEFYEGDLEKAVIRSLKLVEGTYGIAVLHVAEHARIVVARKGSPLVIRISNGEHFIASDIPAMVEHTRDVIFLVDGQDGAFSGSGIPTLS